MGPYDEEDIRTDQLEWEYAIASKNICDVLTDEAGSDISEHEHPDTTSTPEDHQGRIRNKTEVLLGKCADQAELERRISNYHETNGIPRENIKIHPDNGGDPLLYGYVYLGGPIGSEQFKRHQVHTLIDDFIHLCECDVSVWQSARTVGVSVLGHQAEVPPHGCQYHHRNRRAEILNEEVAT